MVVKSPDNEKTKENNYYMQHKGTARYIFTGFDGEYCNIFYTNLATYVSMVHNAMALVVS